MPATALRSVDLPDPLDPMTLTNWPAGRERSTPLSATISLAVPAKKTLRIALSSRGAGALMT